MSQEAVEAEIEAVETVEADEELFENADLSPFRQSQRGVFLFELEDYFIALARQTDKDGELAEFRKLVDFLLIHLDILRSIPQLYEKLIQTCQELKEDNKNNTEFVCLCQSFLDEVQPNRTILHSEETQPDNEEPLHSDKA